MFLELTVPSNGADLKKFVEDTLNGYSLTLSGPAFLYNFEDQVGVESSTTYSRYFSACIRGRKFWIVNPKN